LDVVRDFANACNADPGEAERLWQRARYEAAKESAPRESINAVHIDYVQNYSELYAAIVELYRKDGCRSYRDLSERAGGHGRLPHTTISRVLSKEYLPRRDFVMAFAQACGVQKSALDSWGMAWERADAELLTQEERARRSQKSWRERSKRASKTTQDPYRSLVRGGRERYRIVDCAGCYRVIVEPEASLAGEFWCADCGRDRIPRSSWNRRR
jgi:predicted RNA-binding Zn-ribbon protein involved in translation (DUF1610 family)